MKAAAAAFVAVALAACLASPPGARAGDVDRKLEAVESALRKDVDRERRLDAEAAALGREIAGLRAESVATAGAVQRLEERLTELEEGTARLARAEAEQAAALARRRTELVAMLGALERLGRQPPEALIAAPATLTEIIRTRLLLAAAVPALGDEARKLRAELDSLAALRRTIAAERAETTVAEAEYAGERRRLDSLIRRKSAQRHATLDERRQAEERVARLAAEADDLRDLLEKLAAPAPPGDKPPVGANFATLPDAAGDGAAARSFSAARGTLPLPVRGRLVGRFGQTAEGGGRIKGITIETRPGAQVVSPYDGRAVFVGPFRGYGQLLIIDHGEGYHTLLAGFARIDCGLGQWLLAGEPVGVMGARANGKPKLYVELRRHGEAISPLPWLAASEGKVGG